MAPARNPKWNMIHRRENAACDPLSPAGEAAATNRASLEVSAELGCLFKHSAFVKGHAAGRDASQDSSSRSRERKSRQLWKLRVSEQKGS